MEMTTLKLAWSIYQKDIYEHDTVQKDKLFNLIHGKSKSEISKIKNGLIIKFSVGALSLCASIILLLIAIYNPVNNPLHPIFSIQESIILFGLLVLLILAMLYFNVLAFSRIAALEQSSESLAQNLKTFIAAMNKALRFNLLSDTLATPLIGTWVYYGFAFRNYDLGINMKTISLFFLPIGIGMVSYFINKLIHRLKFGPYLDRLNQYAETLKKNSPKV